MLYRTRAYMLRQVITEDGTQYFIGFKDGQGVFHELNVPYDFFMAFRRLELDNRKLENWDYRHREFNEVYEETLNRRALRLPKNVDELIIEEEQTELLYKTINALPEIQKRHFLLYHEYDCNFYEIGEMEHCTPQAVRRSVILAREKIKTQMKKYLCA
ncbi:sigma-70 family RNA polymerase sigma factor [bacterium D16-51]|nr:sigma-70 family RNA polymerase sigma factor [bacterium D16-59]RKI54570.1 sigma-70 family RNA polymerase sigma factor [bacterium D16-51]